ncbi:MAG TPA: hypothetical protein VFS90_01840 [Pyrinomonadaceae bacterium]|nr:hypothetical protein [Pyrinomonadaceae bacterium]
MKKLFTMATLVMVSWSVVYAQQQAPSLKPSMSAPRHEGAPPLLLEIVANPAMPPGYSNVNGPNELGKFVGVMNFVRVPGSSPSGSPIRMVKVEPQFNGETAAVRVTLIRGVKGIEQEDFVGIYRLGVGEQRTLNDLRAVGIEPFTITLLDTVPPLPPSPAFDNKTKSIEIVSVRSENSPNPAYIITFRNLSEKSVAGLGFDMTFDDRPGPTGFFADNENRPLIEAGGTVEQYVRALMPRRTPTGFVPSAANSTTIRIRNVIFSDLSYEGEVRDACHVETARIGRSAYLTKVISLLDQQLAENFTDNIEAVRQFREKFEALSYDTGDSTQTSSVSPACTDLAQKSLDSANVMKLVMLRDLNQIITTRPRPPFTFRAWMETRRANYQAWLARL